MRCYPREHLQAIQARGLTLRIAGLEKRTSVAAAMIQLDSVRTFKSHQAHAAASSFIPLLGSQTAVVTAMNGIPWWYFYKECSEFEGRQLETVDPQGRQWKSGETPWHSARQRSVSGLCRTGIKRPRVDRAVAAKKKTHCVD